LNALENPFRYDFDHGIGSIHQLQIWPSEIQWLIKGLDKGAVAIQRNRWNSSHAKWETTDVSR
jgi:hypothetical protein